MYNFFKKFDNLVLKSLEDCYQTSLKKKKRVAETPSMCDPSRAIKQLEGKRCFFVAGYDSDCTSRGMWVQ